MSNRPGRKISRQAAHKPQHRKSGGPSLDRRLLVAMAAMAAVGLAIALVAVLAGGGSGPTPKQTSSAVQVFGSPLPSFDGGAPDTAIGMVAPGFTTIDFDGIGHEVIGNGGPADSAKIVGIFAHWCPHCQKEVPIVSKWLKENQLPDRVEVVTVSSLVNAGRSNYPPSKWFESVAYPTPVLLDSPTDEIADAFGLTTVPYWIVLGPDNVVLERQSGEIGTAGFGELVDAATASLNN